MALHKDIVNVQVEMLRQFQIQQVSDNLYFISNIINAPAGFWPWGQNEEAP